MRTKQLVALASAALVSVGVLGIVLSARGMEPEAAAKQPPFDPASPVAVQQLREQSLATLTAMLDSPIPELRANAIEGLLVTPQRLEPALRKALRDPSPGVRAVAAMAVGKAKAVKLADVLRPLLEDPSEFVRMNAIYGLAKCGQNVDQTPLAGYLLNGSTLRVKSQAAYILGELGNKSAVPLLREASVKPVGRSVASDDRLMRLQIAEALVKLGDDAGINEIRAALYPAKVEDFEATAMATQILGLLRDRSSMGQLMELTTRTDDAKNLMPPEIRMAAGTALARLGQRAAHIADDYLKSQVPTQRAQAAMALGDTGDRAQLAKLAAMATDAEPAVRLAAAAAALKIIESEPAAK